MYCTFLQAIEKHSKSLIFHLKVTSLRIADVMSWAIVDQALLSHRLRVDSVGYQRVDSRLPAFIVLISVKGVCI